MAKKTTPQKRRGSGRVTHIPFAPAGSQEEYIRFTGELKAQTDRGAAVLGASFLEWRVTQAIQTRVKVWDKHAEDIFGSEDKSGGELSAKYQAKMAYCLGLIGKDGLSDALLIGQIRNRFAHRLSVHSFTADHVVREWCRQLKSPEALKAQFKNASVSMIGIEPPIEPRERFIATVHLVAVMLWSQAVRDKMRWPTVKPATIFW